MALSFFLLTLALSTPGPTPGFASEPEKEFASSYDAILPNGETIDSLGRVSSIEDVYLEFFFDEKNSYEEKVIATAECKYFKASTSLRSFKYFFPLSFSAV